MLICLRSVHVRPTDKHVNSLFFNEELEEKYLQCSMGLKCTYLKITCQGVQVAHRRDDFIWKLSHRPTFIISWKSGNPPGSAANFDKYQLLFPTTRWHCDAAINCRAFFFKCSGFNLLNTEYDLLRCI